jgi:hypothetical protein
VLGLADASVLATLSEAVLLVVNEATNRRVLAHARDQLAKVRSRVVGAVLNNFGPATSYYYYADYYAYTSSYYYEAEPEEKSRRKKKDRKAKEAAKSERRKRRGKSGSTGNGFETGVDLETDTVEVAGPATNGKAAVSSLPARTDGSESEGAGADAEPDSDSDTESTTSFFK